MDIIDYFIKRLEDDDLPLNWKEVDGLEVREMLKGSVLKRTDPVDYPYTDGLLMCFLDTEGRIILIDVGNSSLRDENGEPFYICAAVPYPFRFVKNKNEWCAFF